MSSEEVQKQSPKDKQIILSSNKFEKFVSGYLRRKFGLLVLKQIFSNYLQSMTFEWRQILIDIKPHKQLFFDQIKQNTDEVHVTHYRETLCATLKETKYCFDNIVCRKCSSQNTLSYVCTYFLKTHKIQNTADEYQCRKCLFYIAFNIKERFISFPDVILSPLGDRTNSFEEKLSDGQNDAVSFSDDEDEAEEYYLSQDKFLLKSDKNKQCPECYDIMIQLDRTIKELSLTTRQCYHAYSIRDYCVSCELVLSNNHGECGTMFECEKRNSECKRLYRLFLKEYKGISEDEKFHGNICLR